MSFLDSTYRLWARAKHWLCSTNTLGYGIHSPHLYYIARVILPATESYYAFREIEKERRKRGGELSQLSAKEVQLLMRLAVMLRARTMVEVGTSGGWTTAYMASASSEARVLTLARTQAVAEQAEKVWRALRLKNIECVAGPIRETLPAHLPAAPVDMAFLAANVREETMVERFETLLERAGEDSIFVLEAIHYSKATDRAWQTICQHEGVTATMDLGTLGLVFFNRNYERRTYTIRL